MQIQQLQRATAVGKEDLAETATGLDIDPIQMNSHLAQLIKSDLFQTAGYR
jgi:hypothetical protein